MSCFRAVAGRKETLMLINRKRKEYFDTKYKLDNASIDKASMRV